MKPRPLKSQIPKQEFVQIKIKATQARQSLVLPKIQYQITASSELHSVFHGKVTPIPTVLIYFLNHTELMVITTIMEQTNDDGECVMTVKEIARHLRMTTPTISTSLYNLRRAGLLLESPNSLKGNGRNRMLNYRAVQHLNDLVEGEDSGIYSRIRRATHKQDILHISKTDLDNAYDQYILSPDHDPEEEEEYD